MAGGGEFGAYADAARDLAAINREAGGALTELPPEEPSLPPGRWIKENLFSSRSNGILTVLLLPYVLPLAWILPSANPFGFIAGLYPDRGILGSVLNFIFSENRDWDGVRVNLRLMFTQAYPESQYVRVWVALGLLVALAGLSAGLWAQWGSLSMKKLSMWAMSAGGFIALGVLSRQPSVLRDGEGTTLLDANSEPLRESFVDAMADRWVWWAIAAVLVTIGSTLWFSLGDQRRRNTFVAAIAVVYSGLGLLVASLWIVNYGHYGFSDGEFIIQPGRTVAMSTKLPWTVMWLLLGATYVVGRAVKAAGRAGVARPMVNVGWLLSPFITFWVILRDPALDYGYVTRVDIPMFVAFAVAGGLVMWALTSPTIGETGRIIAVALLLFALFHWLAGALGWYPMLQKARLSFLLVAGFALVAPNFIGEASKRVRFVVGYLVTLGVVQYMITMINAPSTVHTPSNEFLGGFSVTVFVAVMTMLLSFPIGVLLALARTSTLPIFRLLATTYIEVVRGVPLITVLFFFSVMINLFLPGGMSLSELAAVTTGFVLFSAAYLAENVRGGLQSVRRGQFEAADAVGLTTAQRTSFIVLPQALRVSIPPLVGQVIATFKETSLLAIVGVFDFLRIANSVIPAQREFLGHKREGLILVSAIYWIFAFALSKYSQRIERRLGLGDQ